MRIPVSSESVYAPLRYEATRPYAVLLGKLFSANARMGERARQEFVGNELLDLVIPAVSQVGNPRGPGPAQAEMVNVQIFGNFQDAGKIIFDLNKSLSRALIMTDALDIPCGEIELPAPAAYFHFGRLQGDEATVTQIEGAFICRTGSRLMIDLVPFGFGSPMFTLLPQGEPLIGVSIDVSDPQKPIAQALHDSVEMVVRHNNEVLAKAAEIEREIEARHGQIVKVPSPAHRLADNEPMLRRTLALILNAIFYLSAEPEDCIEGWGSDAPEDVVHQLQSATKTGTIRTLQNTLLKSGYTKVRLVGQRFAKSLEAGAIEQATDGGRRMPTHFRRGHFRLQVHGPERALRKRIFVAPVMVNAGIGDPAGKVYEVT